MISRSTMARVLLRNSAAKRMTTKDQHNIFIDEYDRKTQLLDIYRAMEMRVMNKSAPMMTMLHKRPFSSKEFTQLHYLESDSEWDEKIANNKKLVLLQASANWCKPCQLLKPIMEKLNLIINIYWIVFDIDKLSELTENLKLQSVPMIFAAKDGILLDSFSGLPTNESSLIQFIDKAFKETKSDKFNDNDNAINEK